MTRLMTITALLFSIFSFANVAQGKPTNSGSPEEFIQFYFDAFNDEDEKRLEMVFLKPFYGFSGDKVTVYKSWREYINYEVVKKTGWSYSSLDNSKVVFRNETTAAVSVDFARWRDDQSKILSTRVLFVVTKQNGDWRMASVVIPSDVPTNQ
jgi:hypothetical protein